MSHASFEALVDWLAGEDEPLEEHLFACDACTRRATAIAAISAALPAVARGGVGPTPAGVLARLEREGLELRHFHVRPGEVVPCAVDATADLLVTHFVLDEVPERADVRVLDPTGAVAQISADVPIDRAAGAIHVTAPAALFRGLPPHLLRFQVLIGDRTLEYALQHEGDVG